ncbi:hypothetical protein [Roseateles noduli]
MSQRVAVPLMRRAARLGGVMVLAALIGNELLAAWRRPAASTSGEMSL